jgi:tetratricopeptide (TPR) repeat protein
MKNDVLERLENEAVVFAKQKKWDEAIIKNLQIIELDKTNWKAWSRIAKCLRELDRKEDAVIIYEHLQNIAPEKEHEFFTKKIQDIKSDAKYNKHNKIRGRYISNCFNCGYTITDELQRCSKCGWYICLNCSRCGCSFKTYYSY